VDWRLWADKKSEVSLYLHRSFWRPLRNTMEIFHVLPLAAVVVLFVLLATDGQLREIYISYLEKPTDGLTASSIRIAAALLTIALLSALLYEAHNALSTMRINVFSGHSDRSVDYKLWRLQRAAGFVLAFMPWLGVTIGLFGARNFVADRYFQLLNCAEVDQVTLHHMHPFLQVSGVQIGGVAIILGAVTAFFVSIDERNRVGQFVVACITPALSALLFLLLTDWFKTDTWLELPIWVYVAVAIATASYFWMYRRLYHRRGGFLLTRPFIRTGISFRKRRQRRLAMWAFLPWLGFAIYLWLFGEIAPAAAASTSCSGHLISTATLRASGLWAIFPVVMCCTIAMGVLVGHFLLRLNPNQRRPIVIVTLVGLALAAVLLAGLTNSDVTVWVYRFIGPLATISLELLFLIATFAALAVLSQNSGFPALTLIVLTIVICVMFPNYAALTAGALGLVYFAFAIIAFLSGRIRTGLVMLVLIGVGVINLRQLNQGIPVRQSPEKAAATASSGMSALTVRTAYMCWLDQKGIPATRTPEQESSCERRPEHLPAVNRPYPVFIVAAEGGGIYAASAAATFLAQLEDREPSFARHIFAISGVSGGSIGAAIFHALYHARNPDRHVAMGAVPDEAPTTAKDLSSTDDEETCTQQLPTKSARDLPTSIANIMQDDHLSPIVGSIFPEIFDLPMKRPDALRASFEYSAARQDASAGRNLCARFREHWSVAGAAPALVLNSTWVELGFRVAFAPFRLHDLDESLYSFRDPFMPDENCSNKHEPLWCISLMTAAGVSARFPGLMPPFSVKLEHKHDKRYKRWNFVDGGYSDNSGATTALDIYRALKHLYPPDEVDLRVVLITSARSQPNLADQSVNGTVFLDTLAPINAILKVREGLANDAIGRACSEIYLDPAQPEVQSKGCIEHAGVKDHGELQIVEIQDQTYGLPLGWKISQTSFAVISWMLGKAEGCPAVNQAASNVEASKDQTSAQSNDSQNTQLTKDILRRNSCVSRLLMELVRGAAVPGGALP
jgi:predicted acylesterase/phospholipase RssA